MVSVDISHLPTVQLSSSDDVNNIMNYPALGDCMLIEESSSLGDDVNRTHISGVTVQGVTGGKCATTAAPAQGTYPGYCNCGSPKRPTLVDLIKSNESLRKDKERAKARYRVELPKPKASAIEAMLQLYADGGHPEWSVLAVNLEAARPFQISTATFRMILETGQALAHTPNGHILTSLMKNHGNPTFASLLDSKSIAQVSKMPGANIRVMVTTEDACHLLECQPVNFFGEKSFFREYNILENKYYLDIFGVGLDEERVHVLRSLHLLGCKVVYETFREAVPTKHVAMSTWRVYFGSTGCPQQLVRVGKVCE
uniref:AlNc14C147G7433 protein n=1 Tax=Albugo laibachii Nc14 TaxID=890382 RepID=F0WLP8_9STRA|nr:AlNc14C147G7433 [Albugo laibachii Nc14]|eukprot:CCA22214.1 AlNc14C147G7433 [Albugo laibachii Nc14]